MDGFVHDLAVFQAVVGSLDHPDAVEAGQVVRNAVDGGVVRAQGQEVKPSVLTNGVNAGNGQSAQFAAGLVQANDFFGGLVHHVEQFVKAHAEVHRTHESLPFGLDGNVGNFADGVVRNVNEIQVRTGAKVAFATGEEEQCRSTQGE